MRRNTVSTKLSRILYLSTILLNGYGGCTLGVAFVIYSGFLRYLDRMCTVCHPGMYLGWPVLPGIQDTQTGGYMNAIPGCTWDGLDSIVRQTWDFVDMSRFPFQYITFCYFYLFWCIFFVDYLEVFLMSVFSWRLEGDRGTLYHLRNRIHRSNVPNIPKKDFNACEDFLDTVISSHVVAAAMATFLLSAS